MRVPSAAASFLNPPVVESDVIHAVHVRSESNETRIWPRPYSVSNGKGAAGTQLGASRARLRLSGFVVPGHRDARLTAVDLWVALSAPVGSESGGPDGRSTLLGRGGP